MPAIDPVAAATGGVQPYFAEEDQQQQAVNPYAQLPAPTGVDPKKAYWQGFMSDLASNLNQNYRPFTSGGQMRQQAKAGNYQQSVAYNKEMYQRSKYTQEAEQIVAERERKRKLATTSYIDLFKEHKGELGGMTMSQWQAMTPQDRSRILASDSKFGTRANPSATMQELKLTQHLRTKSRDMSLTKQERDDALADIDAVYALKRGARLSKRGDVTEVYNPTTRAMESTSGEGKTWQQEQDEISSAAASKAGGITEAQKTAGYNVNMQAQLLQTIDTMDEQLVRMHRLRERVKSGPATGRLEEIATAWDSDKQAMESAFLTEGWNKVIDMKAQGMTFGNFTEKEFERIIKTIGVMGNTKEANLIVLDRAIEDLESIYNKWHDRYDDPASYMTRKRQRRTDFSTSRQQKSTNTGNRNKFDNIVGP